MKEKAVVIVSGGMDSVTALHYLHKQERYVLYALSIDYKQRHRKELECAKWNAQYLGIPHQTVNLQVLNGLLQGSALTSTDIQVPDGHYEEANQKLTVVPNRNMIMLSIATGYALSLKASRVFYGAHLGDRSQYPDCKVEFIDALQQAIYLCDWERVGLEAPFAKMTKGDIVRIGLECGVPYAHTWTCYKGLRAPCGKCGSCVERTLAFYENQAVDPVIGEARWPTVLADVLKVKDDFERKQSK